jgi:exosome complex RNA-binding protein Rrp4
MFHVELNINKAIIIKSYERQYLNPIVLDIGDKVLLGNEETEEKWEGWIWAESKNNSGWIPRQIIEFSSDQKSGIISKKYSAQELSVQKYDSVVIIESLNGWVWVKNILTNEEGWIPSECVSIQNNF